MNNTLGILKSPPQLAELKEGQTVTVLLFPQQLKGGTPAVSEYRQYQRVGNKLLSWDVKDMVGAVDYAKVFPSTVRVNDIPAGIADYDKFLVSDGGMLKYRTAAQMLTDLGVSETGHTHALADMTDVAFAGPANLDVLQYNGSNWVDRTLAEAGISAVGHTHPYLALAGGLMNDGAYIGVDEIRARDGAGLKLYDDGGNGIFVEDGGNVGIGTVTPGREVEIYGTSPQLRIRDSGATADACTAFIEFGGTDAAAWSRTGFVGDSASANASIKLAAEVADLLLDAADDIILTPGGTGVGIGITTPQESLHVYGSGIQRIEVEGIGAGADAAIKLTGNAGKFAIFAQGTTDRLGIWDYGAASEIFTLKSSKVGIGTSSPNKLLTLKNQGDMGNVGFSPGWTVDGGTGWKMDYVSSLYKFELDDLVVRGSLYAQEFVINQTLVNTNLLISSVGKSEVVSGNQYDESVTFSDPSGQNLNPFAPGDVVMCQQIDINASDGYIVKRLVRRIDTVSSNSAEFMSASGAPADGGSMALGDTFVRLYSETDATRRGNIYLTSTDANGPFIKAMDGASNWGEWIGPAKIRAQMGNMRNAWGYGDSDIYGFAAGSYVSSDGNQYLTIDPTNGLEIKAYSDPDWITVLKANGNTLQIGHTANKLYFDVASNTLRVAGWTTTTSTFEKFSGSPSAGIRINSASQEIIAGCLTEQRVELSGSNSRIEFYKRTGVDTSALAVTIDDSLGVQNDPGIAFGPSLDSNITRDANGSLTFEAGGQIVVQMLVDRILLFKLATGNQTNISSLAGRLYVNISKSKFKRCIKDLDTVLGAELLYSLRPVEFEFKDSPRGLKNYGLIAEEVAQVIPNLCSYEKGEPFSIKYNELPVLMLPELKKHETKIRELHARLVELEAEVETLKQQLAMA